MHVVVATCAHRGDDARIVHREARSLLEAGHRVTLIAPRPPDASIAADPVGLVRIVVPRAVGRRRIAAWRAVRRAVGTMLPPTGDADVLLLHDPELVPLFARRRTPVPVVWDVHEDYVASIADRTYIPRFLRTGVRRLVGWLEGLAIRRCHLVLAEDAYAERLGDHPVVPNGTWVPEDPFSAGDARASAAGDRTHGEASAPPLDDGGADVLPRLVYVGRVSRSRGVYELIEVGRQVAGRAIVEVIGDADGDVRELVRTAHDAGEIVWHGYLPNPVAIGRSRGAFAGLALLHDEPNYRHSRPTKLVEYLAHGVPVITTPLPLAAELVEASHGGAVTTSFHSAVDDAVATVDRWIADPSERIAAARAGHRYVRDHHAWQQDGTRFVHLLEGFSRPNR